jgi:hypothetical protein
MSAVARRTFKDPRDRGCGKERMGSFVGLIGSADDTPAPATAGIITRMRLETVDPIGVTLNADHGKDDDSRRFGIGVDISAGTQVTRFLGKSDDFAHCSPPSDPASSLLGSAGSAPYGN